MESSIIKDIPQELKSFIVTVVNSYTAWDILTYFYDAPRMIKADAEEVASSIGRDTNEVQEVFNGMLTKEVLNSIEQDGKKLYISNLQGKMYTIIDQFLKFTSTREGRLKTIYLITSERFKRAD
ncbi:MAG: hypothetical protein ABII23_02705 [bacterium]